MADEMDVSPPSPRGTKRKGDDSLPLPAPRRIKALAQDVVNKIAAGEIIVAPVHALKELIENAVDAGSTALEILVKEGGLKLLQITDNGHGIDKEDLPILCERFTTSKLKAFEDLTSIGTYGFRGEALASISHIAHLKVEDLFYNVPSRRRAFRSASEEYAKILELVGRYAVHCEGVAFSCKKIGENNSNSVTVPAAASVKDRIRQIHGSSAANELVELSVEDDRWGFKCKGWVSSANYNAKRTQMLLFINHRSVESPVIKKSVEQTYATFLPKGGHPFFYLSLEIEPQRVDVNVHPTKREVHFLNEDEIIAVICDAIRENLSKVDTSRSFMTQSLLPNPKAPFATPMKSNVPVAPGTGHASDRSVSRAPQTAPKKRNDGNLVRTDASARKITSMLQPQKSVEEIANDEKEKEYEITGKEPIACRLTSISDLRAEVRDAMHNELTEMLSSHTFVGIVDEQKRIAAIQCGVKLFLVDYAMMCNEYFYQVGLTDFANYGSIRFSPPLRLHDLLKISVEQEKKSAGDAAGEVDWDEVVDVVGKQLIDKAPLLREYFSMNITAEGELCSIPLLMKDYTPCMAKLPQFLLRLGPHVNWNEEKGCFQTILRELASFYVPESLPLPPDVQGTYGRKGKDKVVEEATEITMRRKKLFRALEFNIFPACKARLVATKGLLDSGIMEVANLKGLYRVFERC
ncbi:MutL DNA mismatch repair enzyme ATPase [Pyrenophora tritici-repentis]|nr:DNA mismatch repair protein mutL [Pyrenophora tritici-repentis]KAI0585622.1 DNA mismatch repair protein mutL [Pyrenophora tritici-repentis]KAI0590168.1 DNA mismatch repair protein mutL [Pyrenophora tritici-repentis]KAI0613881.1 DNA mismatch repair protein mutL [Pyrenophora tritici-repentis]KAI0626720.1 DNA mismatch repair protein mutL [Pyrenophora tritici-repentis]